MQVQRIRTFQPYMYKPASVDIENAAEESSPDRTG